MIEQNIVKGKAARSIIYMTIIGGLLFLSSFSVWIIWRVACDKYSTLPQLTLLEAIGAVSVIYVLYFANQIAKQPATDKMSGTAANTKSECSQEVKSCLEKMSTREKEILKQEIANCCGMKKEAENENVLNISKFFKSSL
jgi:hypothetical protein